jgi:hypothetical protein
VCYETELAGDGQPELAQVGDRDLNAAERTSHLRGKEPDRTGSGH